MGRGLDRVIRVAIIPKADKIKSRLQPIPVTACFYVFELSYAENEVPQPQVLVAFGFSNVKPRFSSPLTKSICIPSR